MESRRAIDVSARASRPGRPAAETRQRRRLSTASSQPRSAGVSPRSGRRRHVALRRSWARSSDRLAAKIGKSALEPLRRVDTVAGHGVS